MYRRFIRPKGMKVTFLEGKDWEAEMGSKEGTFGEQYELAMGYKMCSRKWLDWTLPPTDDAGGHFFNGRAQGVNWRMIRYSDVLLMYAEAVNELYGPRDDAKEALKRVRRRAFDAAQWTDKVESYVESLTNEADFFQAVMDERKWEFGGEGIRKYDLARWNKYGEVIYNLYNEMTNWGLVANGAYVPGIEKVPSNIYYKQVTDPEHSDRKVLDIVGIDEYGPGVGRPAGYTVLEYALGWRVLNKETQLYETLDAISWSFRGFINKNNDQLVKPTDPVRYLCPYPAKVITDHRGLIRNYYGY